MKKIVFALALSSVFFSVKAQETQDASKLQESATVSLQKGDFDNAIALLNKAKDLKPNDVEIVKQLAYANYLHRDYAKAIEISKSLIEKNAADEQCFQVLGLAYKGIAEYDEGDKMYRKALKAFPNSGVLYSEYGDLLSLKNDESAAIKEWEKGIETAPSYSGNYYYASKYYQNNNEPLWSLLYGETFINLESLSGRTVETKGVLLDDYNKLLLSPNTLTEASKKGNAFIQAVASTIAKYTGEASGGITPASLTALRTKFISDWFDNSASKFPFHLFDHQKLLIKENMFESYNQWIFGAAINTNDFRDWLTGHETEIKNFQNFERNALFKVPAGQYYNK